jgi:hypothetical protein
MFSDWGSLTGLILLSLQISIVSFKVIHLGVYALGSPPLLQLGGLYTATAPLRLLEASLKLLCDTL